MLVIFEEHLCTATPKDNVTQILYQSILEEQKQTMCGRETLFLKVK